MKNYFNYRGVSLRRADVIKVIRDSFTLCLGFAPKPSSIYKICCYPSSCCVAVSFTVKTMQYELNVSVDPYTSSVLELLTDDFGHDYPTLGVIYDNDMRDILDNVIKGKKI